MARPSSPTPGGCSCPNCGRRFTGSIGHHARKCGVTPAQLFWAKVNRTEGCWIWTGSIKPRNGYGNVMIQGENHNAHRWAYAEAKGPIPKGMEVMHTCDVPACVNPDHMKLGTHIENMLDCKAKGRTTMGERNKRGKLTEAQARAVLAEYKIVNGRQSNAKELAARYGVNAGAITGITSGRTWAHLREQK